MKTPTTFWNRLIGRSALSAPFDLPARPSGIEVLEARIAPATLAALPGNSSFEETTDFAHWTVSAGPLDQVTAYSSETTVVRAALAPEGDAFAHLSFQGGFTNSGTAFGPSLKSESFTAVAGEKISVVWRATNGDDVAHPRGRLFTSVGAPVGTFFDADTGTIDWATSPTVTVPSDGQYYLLFEAGSKDVSAGGTLGASLDIDAIHRTPNGVTATDLNGKLTVNVTGENPASDAGNTFLITRDSTGDYVEIFVNGSLDFVQPLASIDKINVTGLGGDDQLTVDSSNGLIALANGLHFDGGGAADTLKLIQAGGSTHVSTTYGVGPNAGDGSTTIADAASSQVVSFTNLEAALDSVTASSLTINATAANNAIGYTVGPGGGIFTGTTGKIAVDSFASLEFNNKAALTINGLAGNDTITLNHSSKPAGLTDGISVSGGAETALPGDLLFDLNSGSIHPSGAGLGTITKTGLPTISFGGIEVASVAGVSTTSAVGGLKIVADGDQDLAGQDDTFAISTDGTTQFLTLSLNGSIALYANQGALAQIETHGLAGNDTVSLTGTNNAETFNFTPTAADTGDLGVTGGVPVHYTQTESVVLNAQGGEDIFKIGGSLGRVKLIGGSGSDTVDFSAATAGVVFDLDAINSDQFVNAAGQIVTLGDVLENFIGTSYNDTLSARASNFTRTLNGGANTNQVFPPGDELFFDGQRHVVTTTLTDSNTGTYRTVGYADVTFDEFETPLITNSPSGPGFGTPENNNAFDTGHVYDLLKSTSGGKVAAGRVPTAVATADFNGDGYLDMVTVNSASGNISVLLNLKDGTFGTPVSYKTKGASPRDVAVGNFDANPGLDLAVTNRGSSNIAIFSGDGSGAFGVPKLIKTPSAPTAIAAGHVNADQIDDLVITHSGLYKVSLLLGTGTGFGPVAAFKTVGTLPWDVVIADFNGDGKADIATANYGTNDVSFFAGDGLGGLAAPTRFAVGVRPTALAVADYNLDGVADLAVSNQLSRFVSVLFSNGAAPAATQFKPQLQVALPGNHAPVSMVTADFNGDGYADLGIGNSLGTNLTVLLGGNLGKFSQPYEFDLGKFRLLPKSGGIAVADFNNDGLLDVVVTSATTSDARVLLRNI